MEYGAARQPSSNKEGRPFCEGRGRCGIPYIRLRHPPERERQASLHDISSLVHTGYAPRLRHRAHTAIPGPRQLSYARTVHCGRCYSHHAATLFAPMLETTDGGKKRWSTTSRLVAGWLAGWRGFLLQVISAAQQGLQVPMVCMYIAYGVHTAGEKPATGIPSHCAVSYQQPPEIPINVSISATSATTRKEKAMLIQEHITCRGS